MNHASPAFVAAVEPPAVLTEPALWFAFANNDLLVIKENEGSVLPQAIDFTEFGLETERQQYLGTLDGQHCFSIELSPNASLSEGMAVENLRQLYADLGEGLFTMAGRAVQVMAWDRDHQFCGRCGGPMTPLETERAKRCASCGLSNYPRISPSIIVRINRGEEILLARNARWRRGFYSIIAGFVEAGESVEETVAREVMEEVNIRVKNITYFGSQPWPFPNSLMLGFTAEYAGGDIQPQEDEIDDAQWFTVDNLPNIPPRISIARRLIDDFIDRHSRDSNT